MGVPAFYRWLSEKYPKIVQDVVEERVKLAGGSGHENIENAVRMPFDATTPNPSGLECDNLYIDMNGIIHPCSHPENGPQPTCEVEMYDNVCRYVDRLVRAVRPRRLLYLAIDGVAPRAKMNQQRARRFRSAQEAREHLEVLNSVKDTMKKQGFTFEGDGQGHDSGGAWDSNVITPGTRFMLELSDHVRFYIRKRISTDKAWKSLRIILSDASVPGEGEHKIMDHVRRQRTQLSTSSSALPYNPNLVHVLHGLDADLIMLALATHEAHFYILREEVMFGRRSEEAAVARKEENGSAQHQRQLDEEAGAEAMELPENKFKALTRISIPILRDYLRNEFHHCLQQVHMQQQRMQYHYQQTVSIEEYFEHLIDDIVFMCFFVGNDFLPHLPSLDIRDGALDFLFNVYKRLLPTSFGSTAGVGTAFITDHGGQVNLSHVDVLLAEVGSIEDHVFSLRHETEMKERARFTEQDRVDRDDQRKTKDRGGGDVAAAAPALHPTSNEHAVSPFKGSGAALSQIPTVKSVGRSAKALSAASHAAKKRSRWQTVGNAPSPSLDVKKEEKPPGDDGDDEDMADMFGNGDDDDEADGKKTLHAKKKRKTGKSKDTKAEAGGEMVALQRGHKAKEETRLRMKENRRKSIEENIAAASALRSSLSAKTIGKPKGKAKDDGKGNVKKPAEPIARIKKRKVSDMSVEEESDAKLSGGKGKDEHDDAAILKQEEDAMFVDADDEEEDAAKVIDEAVLMEKAKNKAMSVEETKMMLKARVKASEGKKLGEYRMNVVDNVRLHEAGWKDRYYKDKCKADDVKTHGGREHLFRSYVVGLCWVMKYYYDGCPSWKWYYPFHYAPFASDLRNIERFKRDCESFELSEPFKPVEQLLGVLPSDSAHAVPQPSRWLMCDNESPIIDFYPRDIPVDPNGKAMPWLWVVLLPFIDEERLLDALKPTMEEWKKKDRSCNARGLDDGYLYVHVDHPLSAQVGMVASAKKTEASNKIWIYSDTSSELAGHLRRPLIHEVHKGSSEIPPPDSDSLGYHSRDGLLTASLDRNKALCAAFSEPKKRPHRSVLLRGAVPPACILTAEDKRIRRPKLNRGGGTIAHLGITWARDDRHQQHGHSPGGNQSMQLQRHQSWGGTPQHSPKRHRDSSWPVGSMGGGTVDHFNHHHLQGGFNNQYRESHGSYYPQSYSPQSQAHQPASHRYGGHMDQQHNQRNSHQQRPQSEHIRFPEENQSTSSSQVQIRHSRFSEQHGRHSGTGHHHQQQHNSQPRFYQGGGSDQGGAYNDCRGTQSHGSGSRHHDFQNQRHSREGYQPQNGGYDYQQPRNQFNNYNHHQQQSHHNHQQQSHHHHQQQSHHHEQPRGGGNSLGYVFTQRGGYNRDGSEQQNNQANQGSSGGSVNSQFMSSLRSRLANTLQRHRAGGGSRGS